MTQLMEKVVTADEFERLPIRVDGCRSELVRGRVVKMAPVGPDHGEKALRLGGALQRFTDSTAVGVVRAATGYWLAGNPDHVRAPDSSAVLTERLSAESVRNGAVTIPPHLAVEITSPSDRDTDVQERVQDYLEAGVARVWIIRPELKTITVHRPDRDPHVFRSGDSLTSEEAGFPTPGFLLDLSEFFGR